MQLKKCSLFIICVFAIVNIFSCDDIYFTAMVIFSFFAVHIQILKRYCSKQVAPEDIASPIKPFVTVLAIFSRGKKTLTVTATQMQEHPFTCG
jgi:hypothetical protein